MAVVVPAAMPELAIAARMPAAAAVQPSRESTPLVDYSYLDSPPTEEASLTQQY